MGVGQGGRRVTALLFPPSLSQLLALHPLSLPHTIWTLKEYLLLAHPCPALTQIN